MGAKTKSVNRDHATVLTPDCDIIFSIVHLKEVVGQFVSHIFRLGATLFSRHHLRKFLSSKVRSPKISSNILGPGRQNP